MMHVMMQTAMTVALVLVGQASAQDWWHGSTVPLVSFSLVLWFDPPPDRP